MEIKRVTGFRAGELPSVTHAHGLQFNPEFARQALPALPFQGLAQQDMNQIERDLIGMKKNENSDYGYTYISFRQRP